MMRPSICIATAKALGGTTEEAINSAVSLELLHNALLIHDDIQDESEERRGKPTMHKLEGVAMAINVGDTLTLLSLKPLFENQKTLGPSLTFKVIEETETVAAESAEGQALELGWRRDNVLDVDESDYMTMVFKKTCWLATIYPLRVGALIGSGGKVNPDRFTSFGFFLGTAFQIQDDMLNLFADKSYGKERDGDIWEGKRTLMLIHLVNNCNEQEFKRIEDTLSLPRDKKRSKDVKWIRKLMDRYGSIDYARQVANGVAGAAIEEFQQAFSGVPPSRDLDFLEGLATWVFERK